MAFTTDKTGLALKANIKIATQGSTWSSHLNRAFKSKGDILICTYSLPNMIHIEKILDKCSDHITIIANANFLGRAETLKVYYPKLKIYVADDMHAKVVLVSPGTVWLTSANFGSDGWFENTIGIHNKDVYNFYINEILKYMCKTNLIEVKGYY